LAWRSIGDNAGELCLPNSIRECHTALEIVGGLDFGTKAPYLRTHHEKDQDRRQSTLVVIAVSEPSTLFLQILKFLSCENESDQ